LVFVVGLLTGAQEVAGIDQLIQSRNCYFLALRNHFSSDYHPENSYDVMADDVLRFMDKKGLDKVSFGGHCFGAKVAMRCASKYPERIECLLIVESGPGDYHASDEFSIQMLKAVNYAG
jgi:pimeloyl-ACP methyl ester carboxylesterase